VKDSGERNRRGEKGIERERREEEKSDKERRNEEKIGEQRRYEKRFKDIGYSNYISLIATN
jgi:hypothetical protein